MADDVKGEVSKSTKSDTKNKLNIAMLGHKRIPSREGGIEIVVEELSVRLVQNGHHVTCYNRLGHHISGSQFDLKVGSTYKGIRLKSVCTINRRGFAAMTSSVSGAIHTAFGKYDVVHFHAEGPCAMLWLPKLFGKRCIVTIHGLDHQRAKWGKIASTYIMIGEKCAVRYADEIIVLSRGMQDYFKKKYNRETRFIPNGVSRPVIREPNTIYQKWKLSKDSYILFLGRIVPEKGIKYLIAAYKRLKTDKKLVIAGGSSDTETYMNELKEICRKDDRVIFTEFIQGSVLDELYSNCYVYVLPSDLEGMPLSLLEAMSYGNCCVVSDIEECESVITDSDDSKRAVVFKQGDVNALRESLQLLCDNKELVKQYRSASAEYICSKYTWDGVAEKTIQLYEHV